MSSFERPKIEAFATSSICDFPRQDHRRAVFFWVKSMNRIGRIAFFALSLVDCRHNVTFDRKPAPWNAHHGSKLGFDPAVGAPRGRFFIAASDQHALLLGDAGVSNHLLPFRNLRYDEVSHLLR